MNKMTFTGKLYGELITIERISKKAARKLHENGETIYIQSCKFHPFGVWSQAMELPKNSCDTAFDTFANSFEYYNCSYEQGYYASFYKKVTAM